MREITLAAVARRAGVSPSTASRVLSDADTPIPISERTIERVRAAARELDYVPSAAARALRTGRSRTLGVLGASARTFRSIRRAGFMSEIMWGLIDAAVECRYHVTLLTGREGEAEPEDAGRLADLGMVDGVLVLNRDLSRNGDCIDVLRGTRKPVVYVLDYPDDPDAYVSAPDDVQGGHLATQALLEAGHRRIGFVKRPAFAGLFGRRQAGWEQALREAGVDPRPEWVFESSRPDAGAAAAVGVTAVVCANEHIGSAFQRSAEAAGMKVPADMAMVQFGYDAPDAAGTRSVAAVVDPLADIVGEAVRMLVELVEGGTPVPRRRIFPHTLQRGESLAGPRDPANRA